MEREFVPINVKTKFKHENWFIDVTNLSVEELNKSKGEFIGKYNVYGIDKVIERRYCNNVYYNRNARDNKRDNKAMARRRHKHI